VPARYDSTGLVIISYGTKAVINTYPRGVEVKLT
jgi:hypothetical protein